MSGLKSSLIITQSNFGIFLAKEILGIDYALELANHVQGAGINELLQYVKLKDKWQFSPGVQQLKNLENGHN